MVGNDLRKQLEAFRNGGAPNLDNVPTRSKVGDLKIALIGAISSLEAGEWNLPGQQMGEELDDRIGMEEPEDEGEFIDLNVVEDDGVLVNGRIIMISNIRMQSFPATVLDKYHCI